MAPRPRLALAALCALLAVAVAGCTGNTTPAFHENDPGDDDAVRVLVKVQGEGKAEQPIADATVRILNGAAVLHETTTGDDGTATLWATQARGGAALHVRAFAAGWTDELVEHALQIRAGEQGTLQVTIPLYKSTIIVNQTFRWEGPATVQMVGERSSLEEALDFSDDDALAFEYSRRIDTVTLNIAWNNTPTAWADFGAFIQGNADEDNRVGADEDQAPTDMGPHSEEVTIDRPGLLGIVDLTNPDAWYGVDTGDPVIAPDGHQIDVSLSATFRTPIIEAGEAPFVPALVVLIAAIAAVALLRPRTG